MYSDTFPPLRSLTAITTGGGFTCTKQQPGFKASLAVWTLQTSGSTKTTGTVTKQQPRYWATLRRRSWVTRSVRYNMKTTI